MATTTNSRERIRRFLFDNVGVVIDSGQLQEASGEARAISRRIRELREEGWQIKTHNDRSDLKPGQYILEETSIRPQHHTFVRRISKRTRAQVLARDGYTCQMCGVTGGDYDDRDPSRPVRLYVGHVVHKSNGGSDEPDNLRTLCCDCNQGAKSLVQEPPNWNWLLDQITQAPVEDQQAALNWLSKKFKG